LVGNYVLGHAGGALGAEAAQVCFGFPLQLIPLQVLEGVRKAGGPCASKKISINLFG